jgi:hypothetical protein
VILWINGPFGVGKTTVARQVANATVYNPEVLGGILQRTVGAFRPGDFQDLAAWRSATVRGIARRKGAVVVPMTVLNPNYLTEMLHGLRDRGREVVHVTLHASRAELIGRIESDDIDPDARQWRLAQVESYEAAAADLAQRGPVIDTTGVTPAGVLALLPSIGT